MNLSELKKDGFQVTVHHKRRYLMPIITGVGMDVKLHFEENFDRIENCIGFNIIKGGSTIVQIEKDGVGAMAESFCSNKDNFNKKVGVRVALGRAHKTYNELRANSEEKYIA